ncbi:MAG: putative rane efflux protein [Symbiobacteriaceae bacterium]|nr:putative rane efflux protein [Symbiobacteriaceae bacterium]
MAPKRPTLAAAALVATLLLPPLSATAAEMPAPVATTPADSVKTEVPLLTLADALALAEANNPGLRMAEYQVAAARNTWATAPAQAQAIAPAAALYAQMQYGITLPSVTIDPAVATRQAQIAFEQALIQYFEAQQQVRLGTIQAFVEWQKAHAMVAAQEAALARALTQEAQVRTSYAAGAVARFELLQAEAQATGQKAAVAGAVAMRDAVRSGLEQVIGLPLPEGVQPEGELPKAADVTLPTDLGALVDKALTTRPDLREAELNITARRQQALLAGASRGTATLQLQIAATQYEMAVIQAKAEVRQALEAARGALAELTAREQALAPTGEALRLATLRYEAGLGTYLEVQAASAAALEAEAARIKAAANLTVQLAKLAQATGEL